MLDDDAVDQVFGGVRKHQSGNAIDHHQHKADGEHSAARANEFPDLRKNSEKPFSRQDAWAGLVCDRNPL